MKFVLFYHSLLSDWNHGNAHFLRGLVAELQGRGHETLVLEPKEGWSLQNLLAEHGEGPIARFREVYPGLDSIQYDLDSLDLSRVVAGADVVLVHEWNDPALVNRLGALRGRGGRFRLFFHDTHHRAVTEANGMAAYELAGYDGVLAYGEVLRKIYLASGRVRAAWTWHEAADTRVFRPLPRTEMAGDLVWIGNWGDNERTEELHEFLIEPVRVLGLKARVYGVRYPDAAKRALARAGIEYAGWLPNFEVPRTFAQFRVTVHVPRRPYVKTLPGIPTIRVFEALACGIPLLTAPWEDAEGLFSPGRDYLVAQNGKEMEQRLTELLENPALAAQMAQNGRKTIQARHTCAHRVDQLFDVIVRPPNP
jgi:spore maturation protein CgeB